MSPLYDIFLSHPHIATDSRNVPQGALFFALRGASFDGNLFAADALRAGAAFAVVDAPDVIPQGCSAAVSGSGSTPPVKAGDSTTIGRYILVDDVLKALQRLAREHRERIGVQVIAITGTNGKTTTKELTTAILSRKFRVHSTVGNLNNHIGVPLTLLSMPADTEMAIIEMGASAVGEIAALCKIAEPQYGLITNVGIAHLDGFQGVDSIRRAKGELYDWLAEHEGTAFVNDADDTLVSMVAQRPGLKRESYDIEAVREFRSNLVGGYNIYNIAAAAAIGSYFDVSDSEIAAAVAGYEPQSNRSRMVDTGRNVVIADCYNANPSSTMAALDNFATEAAPTLKAGADKAPGAPDMAAEDNRHGEPAGKIVVLGDMLELGRWAPEQHDRILKAALGGGFEQVFLVGENFRRACRRSLNWPGTHANNNSEQCGGDKSVRPMVESELKFVISGMRVHSLLDTQELLDFFKKNPLSGYFVLLKGSRGVALEKVMPLL